MTVPRTPADRELVTALRATVADHLDARGVSLDGSSPAALEDARMLARDLLAGALEAEASARAQVGRGLLSPEEERAVTGAVLDALFGLDALQRLLDDLSVTDIHAQGCDRVFVVRDDGTYEQVEPIAPDDDALKDLIREVIRRAGADRPFDAAHPELNVQLPDGSRFFGLTGVSTRPCLAIRRHRFPRVFLSDLVTIGTLDSALAAFLAAAVRARKNLLVAGGTGVGKTTMLRALINEVPPHERLVTVEDSLELGVDRFPELHANVAALEAREDNVEGVGAVSMERLVKMALRMDPDRVIVGEVRGDEILPMLNAMSQGNDGSMCTLHADSSQGAFSKLAMYAMQTPQRLPIEATNLLVAHALDFVVHLTQESGHDRRGLRFVTSVREVLDADGPVISSNEVFRPGPDGRAVPGAPMSTRNRDALVAAGFDPALLYPTGVGG